MLYQGTCKYVEFYSGYFFQLPYNDQKLVRFLEMDWARV